MYQFLFSLKFVKLRQSNGGHDRRSKPSMRKICSSLTQKKKRRKKRKSLFFLSSFYGVTPPSDPKTPKWLRVKSGETSWKNNFACLLARLYSYVVWIHRSIGRPQLHKEQGAPKQACASLRYRFIVLIFVVCFSLRERFNIFFQIKFATALYWLYFLFFLVSE